MTVFLKWVMVRRVLPVTLSLLCMLISAQVWANGWAWSVEKGRHSSTIAGSIHLGNDGFYPINAKIMDAFEASDILYVEMDDSLVTPQEQAIIVAQYAQLPDGKTLADLYSPKLIDLMDKHLQELGLSLAPFMRLQPSFVAMNVSVMQAQQLGYSPAQGIDRHFLNMARGNKTVRQIETFESQMRLLAELPSDEETLMDAFGDMADYEEMWELMDKAWKTGDADLVYQTAIVDALKEYPDLAPMFEKLFFVRNVGMADAVEGCLLREERCFVLVGGGHLPGKRGIVELLEERGYQLKALH